MVLGVSAPHRRSDAQDDLEGAPHVSIDCGFLGEKESEDRVCPALVIPERRHKMTWGYAGSEKRDGVSLESLHKPAKKGVGLCQSVRWGSLPVMPGH